MTQHSKTTNRLALLICTAINQMRDRERERGKMARTNKTAEVGGKEGGEYSKREKLRWRESDSNEEEERNEGIRPEIPSLIIVCCDKPL